jgi:AmmeMemoRadiSam system protein A
MNTTLAEGDHRVLLKLAREALEAAVRGEPIPPVEPNVLSAAVQDRACCFVTLTMGGELRGCIGGLIAEAPLYEDVRHRAVQAALSDHRFWPVTPEELPEVEIEISVLSEPQPLPYTTPADLVEQLCPGTHGVILRQGIYRATFLPQVWERVPDPDDFLSLLCEKLGAQPDTWRHTHLEVQVYQVEEFHEPRRPRETRLAKPVSSR